MACAYAGSVLLPETLTTTGSPVQGGLTIFGAPAIASQQTSVTTSTQSIV